ncbi:site-specific DNA-methyltransferase [Fusobacterium animalis]|uniref:site-specific DNA-methyltransferase n=1 Tax=Fusobacterium animalis TaxID=76859 RepID=UPI0030D31CAA
MIKNIIDSNEMLLPNSKQIKVLKENFPSCFKEDGSFDIERFKEYLNDKMTITYEGYELKFLGKNYSRLLAAIETTTVIVPDEEHNNKSENKDSQNIYISGDNLDGLKQLLKSYAHQIKCIYIDPPYNTGSDGFVYNDNFSFTSEELAIKLSINEEEASRIIDLTKRGSASHSAWLMFMYPRLLLARDLLTDDGVIFISIDDNECHNLKLLCDDVFGEENFIAEFIWEKKKKGSYLANTITNIKESIIIYSRKKNLFSGLIGEINTNEETYPCINASNGRDVRHIPAGIQSKFREKNYVMKAGEVISDTTMSLILKSDLIIENGILIQDVDIEGNWRYGQDAMTEYAQNGELYITQDLYLRRIVKKPRYKGLKDLLLRVGEENESGYKYLFDENNLQSSGWGSNEDADEEQRLLFGEQGLMTYPKPVLLLMKLITSIRDDNMIICDFFSGSGTTAEAVMRLNSIGKNHKFIMIQLSENLDENFLKTTGENKKKLKKLIDYLEKNHHSHTLDQLGIERIIRAAKKIKKENPNIKADLGFNHYTLQEPKQITLDKLENFIPEEQGIFLSNDILTDFGIQTILTTWLIYDGYGFNADVKIIDFEGYIGYYINKHLYLIDPNISKESITAIIDKYENDRGFNAENIVLFGYSFLWTMIEELKINLARLKNTEKNLHINFDIRY